MRGYVCFAITDGVEIHYLGWNGSELKIPKWKSNVVKLRRFFFLALLQFMRSVQAARI
jgi:hypothetical protein